MSNRFNNFLPGPGYVSQYVPMPFNEMAAVAENIQKKHDEDAAKLGASAAPFENLKLANSVYAYDSNTGKYGYQDTGFNKRKKEIVNDIYTNQQDIANKYSTGKLTNQEYRQEVSKLANKYKQGLGELKIAEANSKNIEEFNAEMAKNSDFQNSPYIAYNAAKEGSRFLENKYSTSYNAQGLAKPVDFNESVNKAAANFKDRTIVDPKTGSQISIGQYIRKLKIDGVSDERIDELVNASFDGSELGKESNLKTNYTLSGLKKKWNDPFTYKEPVYDSKGNQTGTKDVNTTYGDYIYNRDKSNFSNALRAKIGGYDIDESVSNNSLHNQREREANKKAEEEKQHVLEKIVAGDNVNTDLISYLGQDAIDLKNQGLLKEDGTIDMSLLEPGNFKTWTDKLVSLVGPTGMGINVELTARTKAREAKEKLKTTLTQMAESIGYKKPISEANYNEIYSTFQKDAITKGYETELLPEVKEVIENGINKKVGDIDRGYIDRVDLSNYDYTIEGETPSGKGFEDGVISLTRRGGEVGEKETLGAIKGTLTTPEGEIKNIVLKPKNENEKQWFNQIEKVGRSGIEFSVTGKVGSNAPKDKSGKTSSSIRNDAYTKLATSINPADVEYIQSVILNPELKGEQSPEIVDKQVLSNGSTVYTIANPRNKSKHIFYEKDKYGKNSIYQNFGELRAKFSDDWYHSSFGASETNAYKKGLDEKKNQEIE